MAAPALPPLEKPDNQTPEHWALVLHAWAWLYRRGWRVIDTEVFVGAFRVDVAGVGWHGAGRGRVVVIEAKGHRADLRSDINVDRLVTEAQANIRELREAAEVARMAYDKARTDEWAARRELGRRHRDGEAITDEEFCQPYPAVAEALAAKKLAEGRVSRASTLLRGTWDAVAGCWHPKRSKLSCPDLLAATVERYLITPPGVARPDEIHESWGLLEPVLGLQGDVGDKAVKLVRRCPKKSASTDEEAQETAARRALVQIATRSTYDTSLRLPGPNRNGDPFPLPYEALVAGLAPCACPSHNCRRPGGQGGVCAPCAETCARWLEEELASAEER